MVVVEMRGRGIAFNRMGFMADFWSWDEQIAEDLAKEAGLELSEHHWAVIRFLREYYSHILIPPPPQETLRALGRQLAHYGANGIEALQRLFPKGGQFEFFEKSYAQDRAEQKAARVECLGMRFPDDEARRAHFTTLRHGREPAAPRPAAVPSAGAAPVPAPKPVE